MNPRKSPLFVTFCILAILAQLLAACSHLAAKPAVPTAAQASSPTPLPSPTATPLPPTATFTAAPTPTASATPIPEPTATPEGFYVDNENGFGFVIPPHWAKEDKTETVQGHTLKWTQFSYLSDTLILHVFSQPQEKARDLFEVLSDLELVDPKKGFRTSEQSVVYIGNNIHTETIDITLNGATMRIYYAFSGKREYILTIDGRAGGLDSRKKVIDPILDSFTLFRPRPYGLDYDQTLHLLGGDPDPSELDPALTMTSAADYVGLLFAGLVRLTPELKIAPDLAESWQISPDGKVYTFTLRPGLKFASGSPITAQDFKDCWERAADPKTKSTTAVTYLGDIAGVKDRLAGKAKEISGVKVIDARTLQVTLDKPRAYFLAKLTYPTSYVYKASQANTDDWTLKADASGAYQIREYHSDKALVFERNPNSIAKPAIPYVLFDFYPSGSPFDLFKADSLDLVWPTTDEVKQVRKPDDPLHAQWHSTTSLCTDYLAIDTTKTPMDDPQVRKAFALATDQKTFADKLTGGLDIPATTILPPGMPGYHGENASLAFDPAAAKAALAQSKYKGSLPPVTLTVSGSASQKRDDVLILVDMWQKNLGVTVRVNYVSPDGFMKNISKDHDQIVVGSWCADYPDPDNFLSILFGPDSAFNFAGYHNEQVNALLDQASTEQDPNQRIRLYQQVERLLLDDVAAIPLMHGVYDELISARVKGFVIPPLHARIIPYLSLEPEK